MQDPSDSAENAEPEQDGSRKAADSPVVDVPPPSSGSDLRPASTVLAEVLPGIAVLFGEVPAELELDLVDFGLVSAADRAQISTVLASIGNTATVAGNLGNALASAQGLYRVNAATQALLSNGGVLAVKDGANLGAVLVNGKVVAQARFIPVTVAAAQTAAAIGPALAMVALQMQLNQITDRVRTNIALTSQVLATTRHAQWATLTGLVSTVDDAVSKARDSGSVPTSVWETVAGKRADLQAQRDLYRSNVRDHIQKLDGLDTHGRRAYLEMNAEAIVFDAHALLSSLKAWTGHQALHASRARSLGAEHPDEARLVDKIAHDTRQEFDAALTEMTGLVDSLMRELRIIAELPGRATLPLTQKQRDAKAARLTGAQLLKALEPLAAALRPPPPPLEAPDIVCAPTWLDPAPYLRILRWLLDEGETLRGIGFPYRLETRDVVKAVGKRALPLAFFAAGQVAGVAGAIVGVAKGGLDRQKWTAEMDKAAANTFVAVTDRRIITAKTKELLQEGRVAQDIPIGRVEYARARTTPNDNGRSAIDLLTHDEAIQWLFHADTDTTHIDALAAVLAEPATIPDDERDELERRHAPIEGRNRN